MILAFLAYLISATAWYYGEANMIRCGLAGNWWIAIAWALAGVVISAPAALYGSFVLYKMSDSWLVTQGPYWIGAVFISYCAFNSILSAKIGWREVVGAILIVIASFIMSTRSTPQ